MVAFTFIAFFQPISISGDFSFSMRAMTLYSTSWLVGNVYRLFAQMYAALRMFYGFCVHLCTAFAHVVRLFHTCTAYLLRKFCGFCVRIRLFVRVQRLFDAFESLYDTILRFFGFAIVSSNDLELLKVSTVRSWGFFDLLLFVRTLVIHWNYRSSDLEDSLIRASCSLWLDCMDDPIFRVPLSYFSARAVFYDWTFWRIQYLGFRRVLYPTICSQFTVRFYLGGFLLILIEQYIYPSGVILLCTMLLYGSYKFRYKG